MRRRAGATFNVCYDFTFTLPSYVIETIRLSISAVRLLGREPRRAIEASGTPCHGNIKVEGLGENQTDGMRS